MADSIEERFNAWLARREAPLRRICSKKRPGFNMRAAKRRPSRFVRRFNAWCASRLVVIGSR